MGKIVTIKSGDFTTTLDLEEFVKLPLKQWKKMFRLAAENLWDNTEAVQTTISFLSEAIPRAKQAMDAAGLEYQRRYEDPSLIGDRFFRANAKKINKELQLKVNTTKRTLLGLAKRLDYIRECIPADQLEYCLRAQK